MSEQRDLSKLRLLVGIASFGRSNDRYLQRLLEEYRSMSLRTDIVVFSNIQKPVGNEAKLVVGLPTKNPWSLPFAHKKYFAEYVDQYDLFIYSEDDTLITERNIRAFLDATDALPSDKIAGFLRYELSPDGTRRYPEIHGRFHWDPYSVRSEGLYTTAFFSNEHAACYVLTREQFKKVISAGDYVRQPDEGKYDIACTAATDPYTRSEFQKVICISHIEDFLVHHLPNKYIGTNFGISDSEFLRQVKALFDLKDSERTNLSLEISESRLRDGLYAKDYYEPADSEMISMIPKGARKVLSIGCGSGNLEALLVKERWSVKAIPIDVVIGGAAAERGIELVCGSFKGAFERLKNEKFDLLLFSNILHLVSDPSQILSVYKPLLDNDGEVLIRLPNLSVSRLAWRKFSHGDRFAVTRSFERNGVQFASEYRVRQWLRRSGLVPTAIHWQIDGRAKQLSKRVMGLCNSMLASEIIVIAKVAGTSD